METRSMTRTTRKLKWALTQDKHNETHILYKHIFNYYAFFKL